MTITKTIREAIDRLCSAHFECGEWDRNESDEGYDVVHQRAVKAEAKLYRLLERVQP